MQRTLKRFLADDSGSELMEFGLVLALFSLVAMGGWEILAQTASTRQTTMQNNLTASGMTPP